MENPQLSFTVIGISDAREPSFSDEVLAQIKQCSVFSGGKRHYALVESFLPQKHQWIDITVPLSNVFDQYKSISKNIIVFASGDPLFFGFGATLLREFPDVDINIVPHYSSIQMLAHKAVVPYHDIRFVSLTGRPWHEFDKALIHGEELIGLLTDKKNTPDVIAQRMLTYGYNNYSILVGEFLGGEQERIVELSVEACAKQSFASLNCMLLKQTNRREKPFGIHESKFEGLEGRPKMITKDAYRLISLSKLDLHNKSVFWDIGFCTGSISVEAKLQFPHLKVCAFEKREESEMLIQKNMKRFGTPGIDYTIGDFFDTDISQTPKPDAVFIGGHGGRLFELMKIVKENIQHGGTVVINAVTENSKAMFIASCAELGFLLEDELKVSLNEHNPLSIITAEAPAGTSSSNNYK